MAVRGLAKARGRVVLASVQQHGAQAGITGSVEFVHHIGEEEDVTGFPRQPRGDGAVTVGHALATDFGIEEGAEQRGQVAGIRVREQQLLCRHRT